MKSLNITIGNHSPAVYNYPQLSNLLRIANFNHDKCIERFQYTTYVLPNEHVLVQLLNYLGIDPEWDLDYLVSIIGMKYESAASLFDMVSIYNKGKIQHNVLYGNGYDELLVAAPYTPGSSSEYIDKDLNEITPIIPLYHSETEISYKPFGTEFSKTNNSGKGLAVIAIDIMSLAINYWRQLKQTQTDATAVVTGPHYWLPGIPMINARCLSNRIALFNGLYNYIASDKTQVDQITQVDGPINVNDLTVQLNRFMPFSVEELSGTSTYSPEHFCARFPSIEPLPIDPLLFNGEKYLGYAQAQWIWQLPIIKLFSTILGFNNKCLTPTGTLNAMIDKWATQDIKGMIRNYCPKEAQDEFTGMVNLMLKLNNINR